MSSGDERVLSTFARLPSLPRLPNNPAKSLRQTLRLRAFAKINLGLRVLGTRSDGYHELRTIYQTIDLHDNLEITLDSSPVSGPSAIEVLSTDPAVPSGRENLVYLACELWKRARKFRGVIRAHLQKRIPAGAGLGGGSSDAAATLLGLNFLVGNGADAELFRLAALVGSDVPLFLWGGRVLGAGRGEEVYPLRDLTKRYCLVVFPGFPVSSPEAYRELDQRRGRRLTEASGPFTIVSFGARSPFPSEVWGPAENDFERVVFARWPELAREKRRLIRAGAEVASLTGSGSAVYGIYSSPRGLASAAKSVPAGWRGFRSRTLSRQEYQRQIMIMRSAD